MTPPKPSPALSRRSLLRLTPAVGVAATLATTASADDAPAEDVDHRQPRLADTSHIRTYYRLARS